MRFIHTISKRFKIKINIHEYKNLVYLFCVHFAKHPICVNTRRSMNYCVVVLLSRLVRHNLHRAMFVLIFWSHNKWGVVANTIRFTFILDWTQCVLGDNFNIGVCISLISVCVYAHFFIILTTYCSAQKSTRENVTKDNNSIEYNDVLFHNDEELSFGE